MERDYPSQILLPDGSTYRLDLDDLECSTSNEMLLQFPNTLGKRLLATGTTNILVHTENDFHVAADTRLTFEDSKGKVYIVGENAKKLSTFGKNVFATFNGDFPLGSDILTHLEKKYSKRKTVSIEEVVEEVYSYKPNSSGLCTMYIGGLDTKGPRYHEFQINMGRTGRKRFQKKESLEPNIPKTLLHGKVADGSGHSHVMTYWGSIDKKDFETSAAGTANTVVLTMLLTALKCPYTGGCLQFVQISKKGKTQVMSTYMNSTIQCYADCYSSLPYEFHERVIFIMYNRKLRDQDFCDWLRDFNVDNPPNGSRIGSPFAKIVGTNLYVAQVELPSKEKRNEILVSGSKKDDILPYLRRCLGVFGIREYNYRKGNFYATASSEGFLRELQVETDINEESQIPAKELKYAK